MTLRENATTGSPRMGQGPLTGVSGSARSGLESRKGQERTSFVCMVEAGTVRKGLMPAPGRAPGQELQLGTRSVLPGQLPCAEGSPLQEPRTHLSSSSFCSWSTSRLKRFFPNIYTHGKKRP